MAKLKQFAGIALDGEPIGMLEPMGNSYRFAYFTEYLNSPASVPLSLSYPLSEEPFDFSFAGELPPYFHHLLPEGWLKDIAETAKLPMETLLEKLTTLCRDNLGATEVYGLIETSSLDYSGLREFIKLDRAVPETSQSLFVAGKKHRGSPEWEHCCHCLEALPVKGYNGNFHDGCAQSFFGTREAPVLAITNDVIAEVARNQLQRGESLTGVQPKFSAIFKHGRGAISDTAFIIKPEPQSWRPGDGIQYKNSAVAEQVAMRFAKFMNLDVAETALVYLEDGQPALVSKRFDRSVMGKIHTEDAAQALGIRDKYKCSHEKIVGLLRNNPDTTARAKDLNSFLKLTLLNFVIGNSDGHLKNLSFVHSSKGRHHYCLAPFYDILPVKAFATKDPDELALTVNGRKNKLKPGDFVKLAVRSGIKATTLDEYIEEIAINLGYLYAGFSQFGVPEELVESIRAYSTSQIQKLQTH